MDASHALAECARSCPASTLIVSFHGADGRFFFDGSAIDFEPFLRSLRQCLRARQTDGISRPEESDLG